MSVKGFENKWSAIYHAQINPEDKDKMVELVLKAEAEARMNMVNIIIQNVAAYIEMRNEFILANANSFVEDGETIEFKSMEDVDNYFNKIAEKISKEHQEKMIESENKYCKVICDTCDEQENCDRQPRECEMFYKLEEIHSNQSMSKEDLTSEPAGSDSKEPS